MISDESLPKRTRRQELSELLFDARLEIVAR